MLVKHSPLRAFAFSVIGSACLLAACSEKPDVLLNSAKAYLAKHDNKAAIIQIKNALQVNPNLPDGRFLLGSALLEGGDATGAEAELRKSMELQYSMNAVVPELAKSILAQGKSKVVTDEFSDTRLEQATAQASLQHTMALAYAMQGQTDKYESSLESALQADPGFGPALLERARQLTNKRDFEGAQALIDSVITKSPDSYEAWKLKGDIYGMEQGKADAARDAYQKAVALKPDFLAAQGALIMVLLQQTDFGGASAQLEKMKVLAPNHPQTQYLAALMAYHKKNFKEASEQVQAALKAAPNHAAALQLAGVSELRQNHLPQAQAFLGKALEVQPTLQMARRSLIVAYLRSGQIAKAMEALLPGLQQAASDPALAPLAGEVYLRSGNLAKAQEYFAQASTQDPQNGNKKTSLALVHLMRGGKENAYEELREISATDTGATADLALISAYLGRKDYGKARTAIDTLEKKQATKALPPYLRAQVFVAMHNPTEARAQLERAVLLEPTFFPASAMLAALDLNDGKPADARRRFDALLLKDPKNGQALLALADVAVRTGASNDEVGKLLGNAVAANPSDVKARLLLIDFYLHNKDLKGASSAAQNAAASLPNESQILDALGRTQKASGDFNQALATYRKMLELLPQSPLPLWKLADIQMAMKDKDAAINSLRKALDVQPDFPEAQRALIALYVSDKKYPDALDVARAVQKQHPKKDVGYILECDIHAAGGQWDAAAQALRAGLVQISTTTLAIKLHYVLQAAEKGAEADRFALSWKKDHPKDVAFVFYLGDQALAGKDYSNAERHYASVVAQQPNNPLALNNLAWVGAKLKRDGAIAYAERAVTLAPNEPMFMDTLATLRSEKGDYARALDLETRALALQPQNRLLMLNLAKIHFRAGKKELAKKSLDDLIRATHEDAVPGEVAALQKDVNALPDAITAR